MPAPAQLRVVWVYENDHRDKGFLCQGIETLLAAGCRVTVVDRAPNRAAGGSDFGHVTLGRKDLVRDILIWLHFHDLARRWQTPSFFVRGVIAIAAQQPSVVIATALRAAFVGWVAAAVLRARFVYFPFELYGDGALPVSKWLLKLEKLIIRTRVHALITQNEHRARVYVEEGGCRVTPTIVHNYRQAQPVTRSGQLRALLGLPDECRIVLFEGRLSGDRCLDQLARSAAHLADDTRLVFMGPPTTWWKDNAPALLSEPEIADKILVAPVVPFADVSDYASDADVGVIIYNDRARNNYLCEPGKLSDYVLGGVPVIAPNFPTLAPVVREYGIGAIYDSPEPEAIARQINYVLSEPRDTWQAALTRAQKDLVWATQEPAFMRAVTGDEIS